MDQPSRPLMNGDSILATIKEGWRARFIGDQMLLIHPKHAPRFIDVSTIKEGDILPRECDEAIEYPPGVSGS